MTKRKSRKKDYMMDSIVDFTAMGASIPITYGILGSAGRAPGASGSTTSLARHMGTGYNLMGTGASMGGALGVLGELRKFEKIGKKRRR